MWFGRYANVDETRHQYRFINNESGQKSVATMALLQLGFSGLTLTAFTQYQHKTIPEIIHATAI